MRSSLRFAAVLSAAALLSFSSAAQETVEKETIVYVHTVIGNKPRSVEEIKFKRSAAGVFRQTQSAFAMDGKVPGDTVEKDKITAHFTPLRTLYEAARDRNNEPCLTLYEGISYSADHVLGYNIVAIGPHKEDATQAVSAEVEKKKGWRPDLKRTYTTCPPSTSVTAVSKNPELPETGDRKNLPAALNIR